MKTEAPPDYPARIKRFRAHHRLTQVRLAELLGVTPAAVARWESGQGKPAAAAWQQILRAEMLGLPALGPDFATRPLVREIGPGYAVAATPAPPLDFTTTPEVVQLVVEGHRLTYGHLTNPAFATETARIDPLPHQRLVVYEQMLPQTRLRFLLADDAGAGKTIMAGLYIREMLARRLLRRILIVPPAGLVSNWERELRTLFGLTGQVVTGAQAKGGNPFAGPESDLVIVSVDTLAGERVFARLQEASTLPYELVIFDEAHKLRADREPDFHVRKTERYQLAEALAGVWGEEARWLLPWSAPHLLLLTATPHMGSDFPYYCLWRLLEPEALATLDAFTTYPPDARARHFIRRTKEEMVNFAGQPLYPERISDTLSYALTPGPVSEQRLYDETTAYISEYYNRARILNRSAARLAMSIFQRRLASSTYALLRSLERRQERLAALLADIRAGRITEDDLRCRQRDLDATARDPLDETTADDEAGEEHEETEAVALGGFVATTLAELEVERARVQALAVLARQVYEDKNHEEAKFAKLREVLQDPRFAGEKMLIFTEHKDTLDFLVRRLEGLGYTGEVAQIHGGLNAQPDPATGLSERDEQVAFFRQSSAEGGARFLVATDAAGEGINLQFCWLMVNYDLPWNPARLEQRMGRIHRYGQQHDPVFIVNLIAGQTREGRVLKTLLEKLEAIRRELHSDKVFDVVGRLFEGVSLKAYLEQALTEAGAETAARQVTGRLTPEQVQAWQAREQRLYGDGGDVRRELPRLQATLDREVYRRLLPGYVRQFVARAAPLLDLGLEGDLEQGFTFRALTPGALDPLWPALEVYPEAARQRLTVRRPERQESALFVHPGEPVFDRLCGYVEARFGRAALRGAVFVDPTTAAPYLFHLALVTVVRQADPALPALAQPVTVEYRLVGLRQDETGMTELPAESLLLLRGGTLAPQWLPWVARAEEWRAQAEQYLMVTVAGGLARQQQAALQATLAERLQFLQRGYDYQGAELATVRTRYREKADAGDPRAKGELTRIKARQQALESRREIALATARREPELLAPGAVTFLAHALVVPATTEEERQHYDKAVELVAVQQARAYEEAAGAVVTDVSTPALARAAGLEDHPGFDLLSRRILPSPATGEGPGVRVEERAIEVKGRARVGDVALHENEWIKACNLQDRYWLYVVYDCATPAPRLWRVRNPFRTLIVRAKGDVVIDEQEILANAET